jgi:predicted AAA+ superfamily ATPase
MLTGSNRVREDVYDEALDEKMAPSLGGVVLGNEHQMYVNPENFFERTLVTEQIANILEGILRVLKGESGKKVIVLNAFYGGGKTHTLLTIYHALNAPYSLLKAKPENDEVRARVSKFVKEMSELGKPDLVVIDGYFSELAPSPMSPLDAKAYKVRTLWGYLAHYLGSYGVLREYDEKHVAPEADKLLKVLENRRVVILIDEIANYIKRFYEAPDKELQKYCSAVETFMEVLVKAVDLTKSAVLIISLPAERSAEEIFVEITYQAIKQSIDKIFKALERVHTEYVEPIAPRNVPALLRTRLFEEVDGRRARDVSDMLYSAYEDNKGVFGAQAIPSEEVLKTYPFHPFYVKTLIEILDKHERLQKTRDLLRISRKVLREVLREGKAYDLIMPWHIDLSKDPIRNTLLIGDYQGFITVVEEDVRERVRYFEKPFLAKMAALALLARTFVYGGGLALPQKVEALPSENDLALMVYEPATFHSEGWAPKDIVDAVRWMSGNLLYVVRDERTGRLWFTRFVTPIKYVEERAKKVDDLSAIEKVQSFVEKLLRETPAEVAGKKKWTRAQPKTFDPELSRALKSCEPIDVDSRRYVLLACLDVPEREDERRGLLEEVLYKTENGGMRRYANTIYVVFPSAQERVRWALDYAKKLIACDEVEREGIVERLTGSLSGKEAEIAREILKRKLNEYKTGVAGGLINTTLGIFNKIAYPHYDEALRANTVKEMEFRVHEDSIIIAVERSLTSTGVGKLKTEMDFDTLEYFLMRIGVDVSEGEEPRSVRDIIDYFYSNPRLPAAPESAILDAIKDGVRRLKIGVRAKGEVHFKRVYAVEAPQVSEGELVTKLDDGYEVLPWRIALVEQMKALRRREFTEGGVRKVEEYLVRIEGRDVAVDEVLNNLTKFDLEQLRVAPIVKVVREMSVKLEAPQNVIEVKDGGPVTIEVYVTRIGPYTGEVLLRPSAGKVEKERLVIDDAFTTERISWTVEVPSEEGQYQYTLEVVDPQGVTLDVENAFIKLSKGVGVGWVEGVPPAGAKVGELAFTIDRGKFSLKPLEVLKRRLSGVAVVAEANFEMIVKAEEGRESSIRLSVGNMQIDDVTTLVLAILNKFQLFARGSFLSARLTPAKGDFFTMPEMTEDERKSLGEHKVKYFVRA